MKEVTFQKRRTKNYAKLQLSCFENKNREKDNALMEKRMLRLIEIQLNKHGWYKKEW